MAIIEVELDGIVTDRHDLLNADLTLAKLQHLRANTVALHLG
jgi:hypothetical protein